MKSKKATQLSSKLIQSGKNKIFNKKKNKKRPSQPEKPRESMSNLQPGLLDRNKPRERKQKKMISLISQQIQCKRIKLEKKSIKKNKKILTNQVSLSYPMTQIIRIRYSGGRQIKKNMKLNYKTIQCLRMK